MQVFQGLPYKLQRRPWQPCPVLSIGNLNFCLSTEPRAWYRRTDSAAGLYGVIARTYDRRYMYLPRCSTTCNVDTTMRLYVTVSRCLIKIELRYRVQSTFTLDRYSNMHLRVEDPY